MFVQLEEKSDQPNVKKLREISQVSECDPVGYLAVRMTGYAKQAGKAGGDGRQTHPIQDLDLQLFYKEF